MIDFTTSQQYTLSIRLSSDGFSFSIYNPLHETSLSIIEREVDRSLSVTANLKQAFRECDFLQHPYKKVNVMIANKRFTIVPLDFFEDEQAEILFYHNHSHKDYETVRYNILKGSNTVVLFGIDKSIISFINQYYPDAIFCSQASPLIEYFSSKSKLGNSKKMYALLQNQSICLYCFEKGHLILANSFDCSHTEDRLYHILYAWKQLNYDQERDELHLTGELADKNILTKELRKYILQVFIMNPESNIDIQALILCE